MCSASAVFVRSVYMWVDTAGSYWSLDYLTALSLDPEAPAGVWWLIIPKWVIAPIRPPPPPYRILLVVESRSMA